MAQVCSLLWICLFVSVRTNDFDIHSNSGTSYEFIYHRNHNLLLTIHSNGCYYSFLENNFHESLLSQSDFKTRLQAIITTAVDGPIGPRKLRTSLDQVQTEFSDAAANQRCADLDVFIIHPDYLRCDFEGIPALCAWMLEDNMDFQWTVGQGWTDTILTGPDHDHTLKPGHGEGHYIFVDATSKAQGAEADLLSPPVNAQGGLCVSLWYNMYGNTMGTLQLEARLKLTDQDKVIVMFNVSGNQGRDWHLAEATVPADPSATWLSHARILIRAIVGNGQYSDIAIDDISSTPGVCVHETLGCEFGGDRPLCNWKQGKVFDQMDWTLMTASSEDIGMGPPAGYNQSTYLLFDASDDVNRPGATAELQTPVLVKEYPMCIHFLYYMKAVDAGELAVVIVDPKSVFPEKTVWSRLGWQGDDWLEGSATVVSPGPTTEFIVLFRATKGSSSQSSIALDHITAQSGQCEQNNLGAPIG